jgi:hypothetical protein
LVYYGLDEHSDERVGSMSIKSLLVKVHALNRDPDWRRYPGERELLCLVEGFNDWYTVAFRRQSDPHLGAIVADRSAGRSRAAR